MSDELHPVVQLLLARMKSNPEEFTGQAGDARGEVYQIQSPPIQHRWDYVVKQLMPLLTPEESATINDTLRSIKLDALHSLVVDELLNGDERRLRMVQEEEAYQKQAAMQKVAIQHAAYAQQYNVANSALANISSTSLSPSLLSSIKKGLGL